MQSVCKACVVELRLGQHLTHEGALKAVNALVSSRLYYCNSLFRSLSGFNFRKLQSVQNNLARIVTNTTRYSHITPVLKSLHWLPVQQCSVVSGIYQKHPLPVNLVVDINKLEIQDKTVSLLSKIT